MTSTDSRKIERLSLTVDSLNSALDSTSCGVVSLDSELRVIYISRFCSTLIEKYFGLGTDEGKSLPDFLNSWIKQNDLNDQTGLPKVPANLKLELPDSSLTITIMFDQKRDERFLILKEHREASPNDLQILGLTRRQAEIMFWVSRGKTDKEIGEILYISHRTVGKHLETIFIHLGVETRTAAMQVAISALR